MRLGSPREDQERVPSRSAAPPLEAGRLIAVAARAARNGEGEGLRENRQLPSPTCRDPHRGTGAERQEQNPALDVVAYDAYTDARSAGYASEPVTL